MVVTVSGKFLCGRFIIVGTYAGKAIITNLGFDNRQKIKPLFISEFSYFEDRLTSQGISIRHTRLGRPNDNAHIERFNRTFGKEECTGKYFVRSVAKVVRGYVWWT